MSDRESMAGLVGFFAGMAYIVLGLWMMSGCTPVEPGPVVIDPIPLPLPFEPEFSALMVQMQAQSYVVAGRKYGDFTGPSGEPDDRVGADDYVCILSHWGNTVDGELMGASLLVEVLSGWGNDYTDGPWYCPEHYPGTLPTEGLGADENTEHRACEVCGRKSEFWTKTGGE